MGSLARRITLGIALATIGAALAGCAMVTEDMNQAIAFRITPATAVCSVTRATIDPDRAIEELGAIGGGGGTIRIGRSSRELIVRCQADGYRTLTAVVTPMAARAARTDWGGALAAMVDDWSGAVFNYPADVEIALDRR